MALTITNRRFSLFRYLDIPTYISTRIVSQNAAEFPALTVCPDGTSYKEDVLQVRE